MNKQSAAKSFGTSPITEAMGARISIDGSQPGMFLVIGNSVSPERAISGAGGSVVLKLSSWNYLVTMPFSSYITLRNHRDISRIGPVSVDIERFNRAIAMLGGAAESG
ncbi:MAG: hypothetical protein Q8Q07_03565 [Dehalococcoidales bacterium]|nr:hypothetical protein [Dehalococcoidales bacterium]